MLFCRYYVRHGNAARAARESGTPPKTACDYGHELLHNPRVKKEIERLSLSLCAELRIDAAKVHEMAAAIAMHDGTKISQMRTVACRWCWERWKADVQHQEIEARELAAVMGEKFVPDPELRHPPGSPDPDCETCKGKGDNKVWFADTRDLAKAERLAFSAASIGKDGYKVEIADRLKALEMCAKLLGLYKDDGTDKTEKVNIFFNGMRFPQATPEHKT